MSSQARKTNEQEDNDYYIGQVQLLSIEYLWKQFDNKKKVFKE
jgi:hypothetical protein